MQFSFSDEQEQFRTGLRRFLNEKSPPSEIRRLMATDTGYDRDAWKQLNTSLGLTAVQIPEAYGGQGFGFVELAIVLEEMGRALLCAPYFSTAVLAANAILNAGTEDQKQALLPGIAAGDIVATLAFTEDNGRWDSSGVALTAAEQGGGHRLNGVKSFVLDGHTADLIIVLARSPGSAGDEGLSFFIVDGKAQGLERRLLKSVDQTRKLARLTFDSVPAELLGEAGAAAAPLARTLDQAAVCLANEMVGGAEHMRQSALDYVMMRMQFGRPIASFQAVKHKCADMLVEVELAKSAAYYAAEAAAEEDAELPAIASLAKACASDAFIQTAKETIQLHGGIGFTWDNDTHLWFKRAKSSEVFLGTPVYHRELLMQRWNV
ncbi:MAG TPA: acyl-CoA dehydrogenase [Alphaproteobacteria bacterium]|jgi:alkylation response protein AidB-like acyl-CoA dehydrogenase|nr:acyl-CoA dehydrogenase [Alphaproteobacteria bacterium]